MFVNNIYGYNHLNHQQKVNEMFSNNKVKIFADIYIDPNKESPRFRLKLDPQKSSVANGKINLKFTPIQESFIFHGFRGLNSKVELSLVAPHFSNDKRTKILEHTSSLIQQRGKDYHLTDPTYSLHIKMTIVSKRQLEMLGDLMGTGKDSLLMDTSRNLMHHAVHSSHTRARLDGNNTRFTDSLLRESITSASDVDISEVKELDWSVDINKLYYYSLNAVEPQPQPYLSPAQIQYFQQLLQLPIPGIQQHVGQMQAIQQQLNQLHQLNRPELVAIMQQLTQQFQLHLQQIAQQLQMIQQQQLQRQATHQAQQVQQAQTVTVNQDENNDSEIDNNADIDDEEEYNNDTISYEITSDSENDSK